MTLADRLHKLRNFQSQDFWAMIFARPLTILFLLPLAEKKWVTPNRITILAILTKLAGIYLLAAQTTYQAGIYAAIFINLGLVLDNMDGTLARFRQSGTFFGFYFDKVSDAVTVLLLFWAAGYRTFQTTGNVLDIALPMMGIGGGIVAGYAKWVADRVLFDLALKERMNNPAELQSMIVARVEPDKGSVPPSRTTKDWLKWLGWAFFSILMVNEVDIFFWLGLALVFDYLPLFTRVICPLLALGLIVGPYVFGKKIFLAEKRASHDC